MESKEIPLLRKREFCPSCHCTESVLLYRESFSSPGIKGYLNTQYAGRASTTLDNDTYELVQCPTCGLTYQLYVPSDNLLFEIYDVWIPKSSRDDLAQKYTLDSFRYISDQIQFMIQFLRLKPREISVLDFGFGWGEWSRMAMAYGCEVFGTELSHERIEYAGSIGLRVLNMLELPRGRFDFINTEEVFEHLVDPRAILAGLTETLRENGVIKISVPALRGSVRKLLRTGSFSLLSPDDIMPIAPLEHVNSFTYKSLVKLAHSVGLQPIVPNFFMLYNSSSGWLEARSALRQLARPIYRHVVPKSPFIYFVRTKVRT